MNTSADGPNFAQEMETSQESGCLICTALKRFQSGCVHKGSDPKPQSLCSVHTWLIAKSVDAETAADTLLSILERALEGKAYGFSCEICSWVEQREQAELEEFIKRLQNPTFQTWFHEHGGLCIPHARRLFDQVPKDFRDAIVSPVKRDTRTLKASLIALLQSARAGTPTHPGILGRVAEHLVGKRGLQIR